MTDYDALAARMLESVQNARVSAEAAEESAENARQTAEGRMQGTALNSTEQGLLLQILQLAADKNSEMQPIVDELKKLWQAG